MRVAVIYHFFPHYRAGIIEGLLASADEVKFVGSPSGEEGIKAYVFDNQNDFIGVNNIYFGKLLLQPKVLLLCLLSSFDCFVFLANPNFVTTWLGAAICRLRGKRVVFWGHGFKSPKKNFANRVRKIFFSLANSYYSYGWRAKRNAVALGFDPAKIHVGFNSLNYPKQLVMRNLVSRSVPDFVNETDKDYRQRKCLKIICISRLIPSCRYDLLLHAVDLYQQSDKTLVSIEIIGDGPSREHLEDLAQKLSLQVQFLGAIYDEEIISRHVYAADVTVSPGKLGLTSMHSLMYGTPAISHDNFESQMPEIESIFPGRTGMLFKEDDAQDLARVLKEFSAIFLDRERIRRDCFRVMDEIYNPSKQVAVLADATKGRPALTGEDMLEIFAE